MVEEGKRGVRVGKRGRRRRPRWRSARRRWERGLRREELARERWREEREREERKRVERLGRGRLGDVVSGDDGLGDRLWSRVFRERRERMGLSLIGMGRLLRCDRTAVMRAERWNGKWVGRRGVRRRLPLYWAMWSGLLSAGWHMFGVKGGREGRAPPEFVLEVDKLRVVEGLLKQLGGEAWSAWASDLRVRWEVWQAMRVLDRGEEERPYVVLEVMKGVGMEEEVLADQSLFWPRVLRRLYEMMEEGGHAEGRGRVDGEGA